MDDDLLKYMGQWEKALKTDDFKKERPEVEAPYSTPSNTQSFFGNFGANHPQERKESDFEYWKKVYNTSIGQHDPEDLVTEDINRKDMTKALTNSANPVYPNTVGKDQDIVAPKWSDSKELTKLITLKSDLQTLESKLNALDTNEKNGKSVQSQIDSMKKEIDRLSNLLSPSMFDNE